MNKVILGILAVLALAACDPALDGSYRREGAGLTLHNSQTSSNTQNLANYFEQLCLQAGYSDKNCAPTPGSGQSGTWNLLVQTGYNDIDFRCDNYLNWIDGKRTERIIFDGTTNAFSTLAAGLAKGSSATADQLADLALILGFTRELYSTYQNSILLGLEGSTIKEIVNKRRSTHRQEFASAVYSTRADSVFAMRRYLTYCTPQSILTDVNTFSRDAADGVTPPIREEAREAATVVNAPQSGDPVTPGRRDELVLPSSPIASFKPFGTTEVRLIQSAACIAVDGDVGPDTNRAVLMIHQFRDGFDNDPKISFSEWTTISETLASNPCDRAKFKNIYENLAHSSNDGKGAVNSLIPVSVLDASLRDRPLNDSDVRIGLSAKRQELDFREPSLGIAADSTELTPMFYNRLIGG